MFEVNLAILNRTRSIRHVFATDQCLAGVVYYRGTLYVTKYRMGEPGEDQNTIYKINLADKVSTPISMLFARGLVAHMRTYFFD